MDFVFWKTSAGPGHCVCKAMQDFDDDYLIGYGDPVADVFPSGVYYKMSDELPKDIQLADAVDNYDDYLLVSARLKEYLAERVTSGVEFLPVSILNHKGRVASDEYFVVNVTATHDALDLDRSEVEWNSIDTDLITKFRTFVLAPDRIPEACRMLRLKHFPGRVLVRRSLADEIEKAGFSGVSFVETEGFER